MMRYTKEEIKRIRTREQLRRMANLYKAMLDKRRKYWINQKKLEGGTILIEWQFYENQDTDFIYLCPNDTWLGLAK